jgi:hypothetical protein
MLVFVQEEILWRGNQGTEGDMKDNRRSGIPAAVWQDFETRNANGEAFKIADFARMLERARKSQAQATDSQVALLWGELWKPAPFNE